MDRPDSDAIYHMRRALRGLDGFAPKPTVRDLQRRFEAALKQAYQESAEAHLIAEDVIRNMALSGRILTPRAREALVRRCLDLVRAGKPPSPPVWLLYEQGDLVGVYSDRTAAKADQAHLIEQAREESARGGWPRGLTGAPEDGVEVVEHTPRTSPRFDQTEGPSAEDAERQDD